MSRARGITISVTAETNAGRRRHMEDYVAVKLCPNDRLREVPHLREQAFIGVFDGHGGKEAAKFARARLWEVIQDQPKYQLNDIESVCESLREAFEALHKEMEPLRASWKNYKLGDLSTAGTTASIIIFRQNHIFVANVGDSTAVLAESNPKAEEPGQHQIIAKVLTKDHRPDDPDESRLIERLGGSVMVSRKPGDVPRVVWERHSINGEQVDFIPFLSVSRSLGDFWSYCPRSGEFVVSPTPDVHVHSLNPKVQKFIIIASDGLWNVMSPKEVVEFIWDYEHEEDEKLHQPRDVVRAIINEALSRWNSKLLLADNIAVLITFLSDDGSCSPSVANIGEKSISVNNVHTTKSGSTSHYRETFSDGVTVECHTKIRLRQRKRHHNSSSKVKASSSCSSSCSSSSSSGPSMSCSVDSMGTSSKRVKLDLPDSSSDKMDAEDISPPSAMDVGEEPDYLHVDQPSSGHSSGV